MRQAVLLLTLILFSITGYAQEQLILKKTHYPSGKIKEEFQVDQNGNKQGFYVKYFENGVKQYEFNFSDNKKNGSCITRYMNGKVNIEANYIADKLSGTFKAWDEAGNLIEQESYK
jgi:antitoxin component YwqK of YwqJK toxin-antitoxin module